MSPVLEMNGVGLRFGSGPEHLTDIALTIAPGTVVAVSGPAGSGKTLLAEVATLGRRPSRGSVRLFGQECAGAHPQALARLRRRIGYVEAAPVAIERISAVEEAALPLRLAGMVAEEAHAQAAEMLAWLGQDATAGAGAPLARRVSVARAAMGRPELMVVDEIAAFPEPDRRKLFHLISQWRQQGVAFLVTSREPAALAGLPHRFVLTNGRLSGGDEIR